MGVYWRASGGGGADSKPGKHWSKLAQPVPRANNQYSCGEQGGSGENRDHMRPVLAVAHRSGTPNVPQSQDCRALCVVVVAAREALFGAGCCRRPKDDWHASSARQRRQRSRDRRPHSHERLRVILSQRRAAHPAMSAMCERQSVSSYRPRLSRSRLGAPHYVRGLTPHFRSLRRPAPLRPLTGHCLAQGGVVLLVCRAVGRPAFRADRAFHVDLVSLVTPTHTHPHYIFHLTGTASEATAPAACRGS